MRVNKTLAALAGAVLVLPLAACGGDDDGGETATVEENPEFESGTTMADLSEAGTVTIGTKFDQPGFGLLGLEDKPEGFDVEIGKIIAGALGIADDDIEWKETPSDVREQVIEDGEVDFVVATYTINDERKQRISFAGPYYEAGQMLMVASDNDTIENPEDLKDNPDAKVCSVTGSTPSENIKQYLANESQLVLFDVYDKCAEALDQNQVQVVTTDNVILLGYVSESDGAFKLVGEQFTEEPYGIGITKGDVEFCEFINTTLQENEDAYLEAWNSTAGEVEGTEEPELPEPDPCS
jgi:glutamate transport system substrate-binding protein